MSENTPYIPVMVGVPETPTPEMLSAVRTHPATATERQDEMHLRIGWLLVAWQVMIDAYISTKRP